MSADSLSSTQVAHPIVDAQYEILRELGRGGTAVVYLARERTTGGEVAIKLIRSKYIEDEEAVARFAREARLVAQLDHPNIVPVRAVLDLGTSGIAIVMAHLNGRTLKQVIKHEGGLQPTRAEQIFRDIASALATAHSMGIVHRDVKPENIFIEDDGRAVLADFGLARSMSPGDTQLTMVGVAIGTPAYMAPEQIDGTDLDGRADIYSLGLVAWEMLSGRRPWDGASLYAILYHQKHETLPDVRDIRDDVPDSLAEAIARSVEKDREDRWSNMAELLEALDDSPAVRVPTAGEPIDGHTIRFVRPPTPSGPATWITQVEKLAAKLERGGPRDDEEVDDDDAETLPTPINWRNTTAARALIGLAAVGVVAFAASALRGKFSSESSGTTGRPLDPVVADGPKSVALSGGVNAADTHQVAARDSSKLVARPRPTAANLPALEPNPPKVDTAAEFNTKKLPTAKSFSIDRIIQSISQSVSTPSVSVNSGPPALVPRATIAAGGTHSCFLNAAGRIVCWGSNNNYQLGGGAAGRTLVPLSTDSDAPFATMSAGLSHTCAIARDGSAWCWGANERGQLGDRSRDPRVASVRVADAHKFRAIAAGGAHSCGLDEFGIAWCWGSNSRGQLGDSTNRDTPAPVRVVGAARFSSIAAGWNFTCALTTTGHPYCWGENSQGQLGDGSTADRPSPVPIGSNAIFSSIAAGSSHACAVTTEGSAFCWGKNTNGQLGDGTTTDRVVPVRVRTDVPFKSITVGAVHTCAVAENGAAYCWGRNSFGQLGTGQSADEPQPAPVADSHVFTSVRAFGSHTCGVTVATEAFCWGYNQDRQLGDGTRVFRTRPVRIETPGGG